MQHETKDACPLEKLVPQTRDSWALLTGRCKATHRLCKTSPIVLHILFQILQLSPAHWTGATSQIPVLLLASFGQRCRATQRTYSETAVTSSGVCPVTSGSWGQGQPSKCWGSFVWCPVFKWIVEAVWQKWLSQLTQILILAKGGKAGKKKMLLDQIIWIIAWFSTYLPPESMPA